MRLVGRGMLPRYFYASKGEKKMNKHCIHHTSFVKRNNNNLVRYIIFVVVFFESHNHTPPRSTKKTNEKMCFC